MMSTATCGRYYTLEVVQNPARARMCGFGDKVRDVLLLWMIDIS
jgi:hypothetical protein